MDTVTAVIELAGAIVGLAAAIIGLLDARDTRKKKNRRR